jgi:hypothetical protein
MIEYVVCLKSSVNGILNIPVIKCTCFKEYEYKVTPKGQIKVKEIPLHAWMGPEGSRRLRLPDFKTIVT